MSAVLVHKAVEPGNLSVKGAKRLAEMLDNDEYIVQPKLDGVYCQVLFDPVFKAWIAYSRTGEHLHSVGPEILAQFSERNETERFIGELWLPNTPHSDINGMARKKSVQPLELHLFDVVDPFPNSYSWRYDYLKTLWWGRGIEVVKSIPMTSAGHGPDDMLDYLYELAAKIKAKSSAYDGLVLKDANAIFVPGNGKDGGAIKIKPRNSGDFRVVGCTKGEGNRAGGMGAAVVDLGGGVTCEVGTGWNMADVHDRGCAYFKDKIIEVEYLSITKDGRLREPVYKSVRFDKTEPDVLACNIPGSD
jgi:ATP-dependent DNA ligase